MSIPSTNQWDCDKVNVYVLSLFPVDKKFYLSFDNLLKVDYYKVFLFKNLRFTFSNTKWISLEKTQIKKQLDIWILVIIYKFNAYDQSAPNFNKLQ